jgi:hypothetical protein
MRRPLPARALCWRLRVPMDEGKVREATVLVVGSVLAINYQDRWIVGTHQPAEKAQSSALEWTKTLEVKFGAELMAGPLTFSMSDSEASSLINDQGTIPEHVRESLEALLAPAAS